MATYILHTTFIFPQTKNWLGYIHGGNPVSGFARQFMDQGGTKPASCKVECDIIKWHNLWELCRSPIIPPWSSREYRWQHVRAGSGSPLARNSLKSPGRCPYPMWQMASRGIFNAEHPGWREMHSQWKLWHPTTASDAYHYYLGTRKEKKKKKRNKETKKGGKSGPDH